MKDKLAEFKTITDYIKEQINKENYPTQGETAAKLWELSNRLPVKEAMKIMTNLGYIPFEGYPLKRRWSK